MKLFFFALACTSSMVVAQEIQLTSAIPSDFGKTQRTMEEKLASQVITQVIPQSVKDSELSNSVSLSYTNMGLGNNWYRLFDNSSFYGVDVANKQYLGGWNLGAPDNCESSSDIDCVTHWWAGRWSDQEVLDQEYITRIREHGILIPFKAPVNDEELFAAAGCFSKNPLRYGDLSEDGKNELVLFLKDDLIVFSPELRKTIFAFRFNVPDWISWDELIEQGLALSNDEESPQFGSRKLYEELGSTSIGYRGYGKMYTGSFASADSKDLLVWRKFYQSRLKKDPLKGFEKISDTYIHYKLVNGEYKKQPTEQSVIKGWLTAKNLTWQKGYPSKSECPGQEGQLIPEMHDPLLNDPDVLK